MATSSITKNFVVSGKKQVEVHLLADTEKYMKQMKYTE